MQTRIIHSSGKKLPIVGLGTWQTFDIGDNRAQSAQLSEVLKQMNKLGGSVIDSSPMYGSSESVVGNLASQCDFREELFYATKVWTSGKEQGIAQMNSSMEKMKRKKMDLIQIHNLLDWQTHVKTLKAWKDEKKINYWGITHYTDSAHKELEKVIESEKPDFVQFNYSIISRNAEKSLFNTIKKNDTAVLVNRPFESGRLFKMVNKQKLPEWSKEYDIGSWGQFFLKFILSNEDVTCVIPGTSKPQHVIDNMGAGYGKMPDKKVREKMYEYIKDL